MTDGRASGCAAEPPIGNQGDTLAQSASDNGERSKKLFTFRKQLQHMRHLIDNYIQADAPLRLN